MYKIKLSRKDNKIRVQQVNRRLSLKTVRPRINLKQVGARGLQGEQGIQGEPGEGIPAGGQEGYVLQKASDSDFDYTWLQPTYSDKSYVQSFNVTDNVLVNHNLAKYPAVSVIDSAGDEVEGEILYLDSMSLTVRFTAPFSGKVTCN